MSPEVGGVGWRSLCEDDGREWWEVRLGQQEEEEEVVLMGRREVGSEEDECRVKRDRREDIERRRR